MAPGGGGCRQALEVNVRVSPRLDPIQHPDVFYPLKSPLPWRQGAPSSRKRRSVLTVFAPCESQTRTYCMRCSVLLVTLTACLGGTDLQLGSRQVDVGHHLGAGVFHLQTRVELQEVEAAILAVELQARLPEDLILRVLLRYRSHSEVRVQRRHRRVLLGSAVLLSHGGATRTRCEYWKRTTTATVRKEIQSPKYPGTDVCPKCLIVWRQTLFVMLQNCSAKVVGADSQAKKATDAPCPPASPTTVPGETTKACKGLRGNWRMRPSQSCAQPCVRDSLLRQRLGQGGDVRERQRRETRGLSGGEEGGQWQGTWLMSLESVQGLDFNECISATEGCSICHHVSLVLLLPTVGEKRQNRKEAINLSDVHTWDKFRRMLGHCVFLASHPKGKTCARIVCDRIVAPHRGFPASPRHQLFGYSANGCAKVKSLIVLRIDARRHVERTFDGGPAEPTGGTP
ncbi:hypothetical protein EYF80_002952 [Liparis tanakae]|uniref:Uncharacterized protein n=1 Tax=Liparis tanakae TaxID=230148 RepID=A0A4Z2J987_9TELE|nr:hypothetical protein EYF80_002952 [Liparis tanakae]